MIKLRDGKYEFYVDGRGVLKCARYEDREWRDFVGDNAVLALFRRCEELQSRIDGFNEGAMERDEAP
jgi:hypothetical protein